MSGYGWDYPAGCTARHIDALMGDPAAEYRAEEAESRAEIDHEDELQELIANAEQATWDMTEELEQDDAFDLLLRAVEVLLAASSDDGSIRLSVDLYRLTADLRAMARDVYRPKAVELATKRHLGELERQEEDARAARHGWAPDDDNY